MQEIEPKTGSWWHQAGKKGKTNYSSGQPRCEEQIFPQTLEKIQTKNIQYT
jgi:hypothetical protein